jgi:pre-mRNA-processing factor 40
MDTRAAGGRISHGYGGRGMMRGRHMMGISQQHHPNDPRGGAPPPPPPPPFRDTPYMPPPPPSAPPHSSHHHLPNPRTRGGPHFGGFSQHAGGVPTHIPNQGMPLHPATAQLNQYPHHSSTTARVIPANGRVHPFPNGAVGIPAANNFSTIHVTTPARPSSTSSPFTVTASSYTPGQMSAAWTQHNSATGVPFYHNSITKQSVYENPLSLQMAVPATIATQIAVVEPGSWTEYTDASTGKKYFSNGVTSSWTKPSESSAKDTAASTASSGKTQPTTSHYHFNNDDVLPARKKKKNAEQQPAITFSGKDEAIVAFKGLLIAKDVSPILKWNEVAKLCATDGRWLACELVLSTGERKQALSEYQTKRANELRQMEREEKLRARQAFHELLNQVVPKLAGFSAWNTRYEQVRDALAKEDRFHVVVDESARESLFLDFCEDYRKLEERKKRNVKRDAQENFVVFLKEKEEQGVLTFASTWNSFAMSLRDEDKADTRFVASASLSDSDRQLHFADFVISLQAAEDDKRRRIRDARRRAEQAQRDAYRDLLNTLAVDGKLFPWSHWRQMESVIAAAPCFAPLHEQSPEAPRNLFEEFVGDWHVRYRHDRAILGKLLHPTVLSKLVVNTDTTYEAFVKALLEAAASSSPVLFSDAKSTLSHADPVTSARVYYDELLTKEGQSNRSTSRRDSVLRLGKYDSSEDEGEIVEDGEVYEDEERSRMKRRMSSTETVAMTESL